MPSRRAFLRTTLAAAAAAAARPPAVAGAADSAGGAGDAPADDAAEPPSVATRQALERASLIYVATRRKSGERSRAAPIWFMYENGELFFTTSPSSWKARRIQRGSPLYIWVGSEDGPFVLGAAEPVTDPAVVAHMGEAYGNKYWIAWLGLFRPRVDRVAAGKTMAYRVKLSDGIPPPPP